MPAIDVLTQGAGAINVPGAVRLAQLIDPTRRTNRYWLRLPETPNAFDELFGETAYWSKRAFWGARDISGDSAYVHLRAWDDDVAWSDNGIWATKGTNIIWSTNKANNIIWS